jgi:hypothetical protein
MSEPEEPHERPRYVVSNLAYYEDDEFTCVECQKTEVWTAQEQQWWYEVAKGSPYSTANRCAECRKDRGKHIQSLPGFNNRLTLDVQQAIKKAVRQVPGIDPRITSACLADDGTVRVRCGGGSIGDILTFKCDDSEWELQSSEPWLR